MTPVSRSTMGRHFVTTRTTLLAAVLSIAAVSAACGKAQESGGFTPMDGGNNGFGDSGNNPPPIQGLKSIALTPTMTTLSLTYPVTTPATAPLKAEGTYDDGHTADVTTAVGWSVTPPGIASVVGTNFTSNQPGTFQVVAFSGAIMSNPATVSVTLSGNVIGNGITQGDLDGMPSGTGPTIAYPLDGALFPYQLGPIEFQVVPTTASQTEARIAFEGDNIDLKVYEPCVPIPTPTIPNACAITVPANLEPILDAASEGTTLTETVRLAAPGGGSLAESKPLGARWSSSQLHGGLYYWSADLSTGNTLIMRYDLDTPGMPPLQYFTQLGTGGMPSDEQNMDPPASNNSTLCFGCHAISNDGTKIGLTFGGSQPALFALIDVASKKSIATRLFPTDPNTNKPFAAFTAFSPDGTALLQSVGGQLWLRSADATMSNLMPMPVFGGQLGGYSASTPFWSPKGDLVVFTGWVPNPTVENQPNDPSNTNGDETPNAEIWIAPVTGGTMFGTPTKLVPGVSGKSEHYPAISDDSQFVVFNESGCSGPAVPAGEAYGAYPCDGYDDPSDTLRIVPTKGGQPVTLGNASQNDNWSNSWPRFAPTHGSFQNKDLYWIAFSSRHPYGATLPGTNTPSLQNTEPQLWFAAVAVDASGNISGDPSFAPVWMPQQNPGGMQRGNHVPQWVTKAVSIAQ